MQLADYIAHLLHEHNCVIVPHFGGFIANYKSAVIDEAKHRITPPTKRVLFNPNLITNDGLLANAVSQDRSLSYPESMAFISDKAADWNKELNEGKRVEIGEIGFLFKQNDQILFEQNRDVNLLLQAYGLSGISFVNFAKEKAKKQVEGKATVAPEKQIQARKATEDENAEIRKESVVIALDVDPEKSELEIEKIEGHEEETKVIPMPRRKGRVIKYLAAAAAIPLLFYSYWIPMETDFIDTGNIQVADFNPIRSAPNRVYQLRNSEFEQPEQTAIPTWEDLTEHLSDNVSVYNYQFDEELYIPIKLDKTEVELQAEVVAEPGQTTANSSSNVALPYHVIGGCFSIESNAEQLVSDLKRQGYSATILDKKGGLYRVSAGDYANRDAAKTGLDTFKSAGFSGWILKK